MYKALPLVVLPQAVHGLGEVTVDASIVDQHVVHLEIRRLRLLLGLEGDEGEVERVARLAGPQTSLFVQLNFILFVAVVAIVPEGTEGIPFNI